jgi:hypothetical protein
MSRKLISGIFAAILITNMLALARYVPTTSSSPANRLSSKVNLTPLASGEHWLEGWTRRKSHTINNATDAGTDYQIQITVVNGSGTDSNGIVYVDGKCKQDFSDVRFTRDDGTTLEDCWLESKFGGENATFWVKISADLTLTSQTIYVYYGNNLAESVSDGDKTFPFFDHFTGSSLNTTKWYSYTTHGPLGSSDGTLTVADSELRLSHPFYAIMLVRGTVGFGEGYAMRTRFHTKGQELNKADLVEWIQSDLTGDIGILRSPHGLLFEGSGYHRDDYCDNYWVESDGISRANTLDNSWDPKSYFIADIGRAKSTVYCHVDGNLKATLNTYISASSQQPLIRVGYIGWEGAHTSYTDWILVRKFVPTEPSHGSWGSEEQVLDIMGVSIMPPIPDYCHEVVVSCTITRPELISQAILSYRTDSEWLNVSMSGFGDLFNATIPALQYGTTVEYKVCAIPTSGNELVTDTYSYFVEDLTAPELADLEWKPTCPFPYIPSNATRQNEKTLVTANVSEPTNASGLSRVLLFCRVDAGEWWNTSMTYNSTSSLWFVLIPKQDGDATVEFFIRAYDNAGNSAECSPVSFKVKALSLGDINGDGYVGIDDIFIIASHFGEENP